MTYRAGIIGAGGIAGLGILGMHDKEKIGKEKFPESHAGGYDATDGIELVAVSDVNQEKLETFGEAWEISADHLYEDHQEMLANESLDVVSVCTPTLYHHDHVVDAATSAADPDVVWCEKPIASSLKDATAMRSTCEETNTELVINHSFRFVEKIQQLRSLLDDGLIGEVKSVNGQFRRELLRNSTHLLDTLEFLLDARPETVSGYINGQNDAVSDLGGDRTVDDSGGGGTVILDDGTFVTIDCTLAREISSMSIQLVGTEGKIHLNNDDGEWRYWRLDGTEHVEEPLPGIDDAWDWATDYRAAFPNAVEHIVAVMEGDAENISSGESATRSLEIIVGFYVSHFTASQVTLPLANPLQDVTITSW